MNESHLTNTEVTALQKELDDLHAQLVESEKLSKANINTAYDTYNRLITERDAQLAERDKQLAVADKTIVARLSELHAKDTQIAAMREALERQEKMINAWDTIMNNTMEQL